MGGRRSVRAEGWRQERRVIVKAEVTPQGPNPRYVYVGDGGDVIDTRTFRIVAHLQPLRGSHRTHTAVALRSLFGTLKTRRLIFANPTRRARPGKFPRRPILGLNDATHLSRDQDMLHIVAADVVSRRSEDPGR